MLGMIVILERDIENLYAKISPSMKVLHISRKNDDHS